MIEVDMVGWDPDEEDGDSPIPTSWQLATVARTWQDQKSAALKVAWRIDSPPWQNAHIIDSFGMPAFAKQTQDPQQLKRRLNLFLYRVGIISKADMGKVFSFDPAKLIGIQRVLRITRGPGKDKPADSRHFSNIDYGCYYALDRPEIPVEERLRMGLALLPGQVAPKEAVAGSTEKTKSVAPREPLAKPGVFDPKELDGIVV